MSTRTAFYNREKPLLERKHVPCEVVSQKEGPAAGPCNSVQPKSNGIFTLRVLQGHRSVSQSNGNTERSIRLELSDEYGLVNPHRNSTKYCSNRLDDTLDTAIGNPSQSHQRQNFTGPIHFPAFQQRQMNSLSHSIHSPNIVEESYTESNRTLSKGRCVNLYELEVGESDFAQLRQDQTLLVEFSDFSKSLIDLLMQCNLGESEEDGNTKHLESSSFAKTGGQEQRFRCRIEDFSHDQKHWNGGSNKCSSARFSIVESNQFRELVHLSLNIEKSSDVTIRPYLSERLYEVIGQNAMLRFKLNNEEDKLSRTAKAYNEISQKYNQLVSVSERERHALAQEADESIQKETTKRYEELQIIRRSNEEEIFRLKQEMDGQHERLQSEVDAFKVENGRLLRLDEDNNKTIEGLKNHLSECETNYKSIQGELDRVNGDLKTITIEKDNLEKNLQQSESFISKLEVSNEKYEAKLIESRKELETARTSESKYRKELEGCSKQTSSLKEELTRLKEENSKSRDLLCRYQRDRQEMKRRMKAKVELIQKQEEILASREIDSTDTSEKLAGAKQTCVKLHHELEQVKKELIEAKTSLKEKEKTLSNNQQVCRLIYSLDIDRSKDCLSILSYLTNLFRGFLISE